MTHTTGPSYFLSTLTAVCAREVVAPPTSSGMVSPRRCISEATLTISSSDGVISPDSPTASAPISTAVSRIFWAGTITPRSITSKLLHWSTTPTMFLPMSCTSPLTVAMTIVPLVSLAVAYCGLSSFSCSMNGIR